MLLLLAAATVALHAEPPGGVQAERQARATVRIERAAMLRFAEIEQDEAGRLRSIVRRSSDGRVETLRIVEFE